MFTRRFTHQMRNSHHHYSQTHSLLIQVAERLLGHSAESFAILQSNDVLKARRILIEPVLTTLRMRFFVQDDRSSVSLLRQHLSFQIKLDRHRLSDYSTFFLRNHPIPPRRSRDYRDRRLVPSERSKLPKFFPLFHRLD